MTTTQSDNQKILVQMHTTHMAMVDKCYTLATESERASFASVIESLASAIVQMQNHDLDETIKQIMTDNERNQNV